MPVAIEALEAEQAELHRLMGGAEFYRQSSDMITATLERLEVLKCDLEECYARWQTLEALTDGAR